MPAYSVVQYTVNDSDLYAEYAREAGPTIPPFGGELIAIDVAAETIEGKPPGPQTVILKFDSVEKAKEWYNSPEYQKVLGKRLASTEGFAVISQAMNRG